MTDMTKIHAGLLSIKLAQQAFDAAQRWSKDEGEVTAIVLLAFRLALHATKKAAAQHGVDLSTLPDIEAELDKSIAQADGKATKPLDPHLN